jgi:hypothetical protein
MEHAPLISKCSDAESAMVAASRERIAAALNLITFLRPYHTITDRPRGEHRIVTAVSSWSSKSYAETIELKYARGSVVAIAADFEFVIAM